MARIQILPLPVEGGHAPFVVVLDHMGAMDRLDRAQTEALRHQMGARAVLTTDGILDAHGSLTLSDEHRAALLATLKPSEGWGEAPEPPV